MYNMQQKITCGCQKRNFVAQSVCDFFYQEPCAGEKDFAILRFHSGPPYEVVFISAYNERHQTSRTVRI